METTHVPPAPRRSARQRLLDAADELFYAGGIHTVGIDRIIERAGVAKASLYDSFGSKEELIRVYLEGRHEARKAQIIETIAHQSEPRDQLLAIFDLLRERCESGRYRGCPFSRATAEAVPTEGVKHVCDTARGWLRGLFADLARRGGAADAEALAMQMMLLYEGASVSAHMDGSADAAAAARATAAQLIELSFTEAGRR